MRTEEKKHEKLAELAGSYLPEWHFTEREPEPGSVLAMLVDDMLEESRERYGEVLHKHKIQYLNLFDKLKEEPVESAKSYVRFTPVAGMEEPVYIARGTRLLASDPESGQEMAFETTHGITTTSAALERIYSAGRAEDRIVKLFDAETDGAPENRAFSAFDISGDNCSEHVLLLAFDHAFDMMEDFEVGLRFSVAEQQDMGKLIGIMTKESVKYSILERSKDKDNSGEIVPRLFDSVEARDGVIWLGMKEYQPERTDALGREQYVITVRAQRLAEAEINGAELVYSDDALAVDDVLCGGIAQGVASFKPFGSPLELYSSCELECAGALSRKGSLVRMSFNLDFETLEQRLPEVAEETNYKIVMTKERPTPKTAVPDIKPDYVLIEYLSDQNAWKRLLKDEHTALLFNGSERGDMSIEFICPEDMADWVEGACRLRIRLMRADNLFAMPSDQHVPVISDLSFSYSYMENPLPPDRACTENNFEFEDITDKLRRRVTSRLFYNSELAERAMYFGFSANPKGSPLSLYFEVENDQDSPLDYAVEYLGQNGFSPVQTSDGTSGMLYSGAVLALVPSDAGRKKLFGYDGWWLRFACRNRPEELVSLPGVHGVITNMAKVENVRKLTQVFYVDNPEGVIALQLGEKNLLSMRVFVNEAAEGEGVSENWVEWTKRTHADERGRVCDMDLADGAVTFPRNVFSSYPLMEGNAAVRVEYQAYQGAKANVGPGAINTSAESLAYISEVSNPIAAYGGYDGYNEGTASSFISNLLRTRGRAVSNRDYFDIIKQVSGGVCQIKCVSGVDRFGEPADDVITVALLIDEYEKGSHIFSSVKDAIREKLMATSSIIPLGKTLVLSQPHFIKCSVRIWLRCSDMENVYELQSQTNEDIRKFIDPLSGGFDGKGWTIGVMPTPRQLLAYLKMQRPGIVIDHIAMAARVGASEFAVDDDIYSRIKSPFAMAVNGEHTIYVTTE